MKSDRHPRHPMTGGDLWTGRWDPWDSDFRCWSWSLIDVQRKKLFIDLYIYTVWILCLGVIQYPKKFWVHFKCLNMIKPCICLLGDCDTFNPYPSISQLPVVVSANRSVTHVNVFWAKKIIQAFMGSSWFTNMLGWFRLLHSLGFGQDLSAPELVPIHLHMWDGLTSRGLAQMDCPKLS
jgi:hypothetical protein